MDSRKYSSLVTASVGALMLSMISISAAACAPQTSSIDNSPTYSATQPTDPGGAGIRTQAQINNDTEYVVDGDGYPMLCDPNGEQCRSNPAYDAFRYRTFAYNQLPQNGVAQTGVNFQPAPVVPIFSVSF
ncbi:MAG TPA: hypothetical protein VMA09_11010 [Candidatus Binataceae bacterium]|nr:hypothetical protein [Candidatus Binataceae bacterium]